MIRHVLIIGTVWPEPSSSAAGARMMQLINLFLEQQWHVTFASTATKTEFSESLNTRGVEEAEIELNNASFDHFVTQLKPDVVMFDRFMTEEQFGWRAAQHCPDALRILDTEDLHGLRMARQVAWKEGRAFDTADLFNDVAKREIASILRCDLSIIISLHEMELLKTVFRVPETVLIYTPMLLEQVTDKEISEWPGYSERQHFVTIGNFIHEPNWNSVLYLKESIWPLIRKKLPGAEMHVYGSYASQKVQNLHKASEGFLINGRAKSALDVMKQARVCLAPLRFGAGIKGKLLEAMLCGTPSVTTGIGAEGMHGELPWNGFICEDTEAFASAAVELYNNQTRWQQAQQYGISIINQVFGKNVHGPVLIEKMNQLKNNLRAHRLDHFIGAVLLHQSVAASKYMALWIEAKNKTN